MSSAPRRLRAIVWELILPVVLFVGWWGWSSASTSMYFAPLPKILSAFVHTWLGAGFNENVVPSLRNFIVGFLLGSFIGIITGVAIGRVRWLRWLFGPITEYLRALPAPAMLPFFILILGIGAQMQIGIIIFGVVFVVLLNAVDGARSIEPTLDDVCTVYRIPLRYRIMRVILPAATPQIIAGLRTGLSLAIVLMVVSEMVAATRGIGFFTLQAQQNFDFVNMWSGMLLLALIGVLVNLLFVWLIERPMLFWQRGVSGTDR
ncbi:MAG: ABC transporter permease [Burkholderiaceae bacterium]|nr:MAG: ABC transporter permease [Burkholderiaceae bacterium]TAM03082.1 MAG: ABC transporter permease [Pusillimonas sp.]